MGKELTAFIKDQNIPDIISREMLLNAIKSGTEDSINLGEIWKILLFIRWYNVFNLK